MAREGDDDKRQEGSRLAPSPYVSSADRQVGGYGKPPKAEVSAAPLSNGGSNDRVLMKRTLLAQSKKIQQLTAKIDGLETEREAMGQQIDALRMAVFEASTRAEQTAEQYKRDAVDAAVREIEQDREAFAEGRREALKRIGELEDALEIALKAAGGVHGQLLELGLSCEDLGKTSVHLSVAAQEAPEEDKPALAVAGETIEAVVGVMRAMEGSGVFDILDPVEDDDDNDDDDTGAEPGGGIGDEEAQSPFVLGDVPAIGGGRRSGGNITPLLGVMGVGPPAATAVTASAGEFEDASCSNAATVGLGSDSSEIDGGHGHDNAASDTAVALEAATAAKTDSSAGDGVLADAQPPDGEAAAATAAGGAPVPAAMAPPIETTAATMRENGRGTVENGNHFVNISGGRSVGAAQLLLQGDRSTRTAAGAGIRAQEEFNTERRDHREEPGKFGRVTGPERAAGAPPPAGLSSSTMAAVIAIGAKALSSDLSSQPSPEEQRRRQDGGDDSLDSSGSGVAEAVMVAVAASRQGVGSDRSSSVGGDIRESSPATNGRSTATTKNSGQAGRGLVAAGVELQDGRVSTGRDSRSGEDLFHQHPPFD